MEGKSFDDLESVLTHLNGYGRIQKILTIIIALLYVPVAMTALIMFFTAANPDWICKTDSEKCNITGVQKNSNNFRCNINVSRSDWEFIVQTDYSIITEFDLVCEREWLGYISTSIFYIGWMIGAVNSGSFANRYGRKLTMFTSWFSMITIVTLSAFSPNIYFYIGCQLLIGFTMPGTSEIAYLYLGEMVDNKNRPFSHMILVSAYTCSLCLLSLKAYYIRKWRYLLLTCSTPYLVVSISYKFVPKSVHWLHLRRHNKELKDVFKRIANVNKMILPSYIEIRSIKLTNEQKSSNYINVFRHSNIKKTIFLLMFSFFSVIAVYYGFFMTADQFDISMYISFALFSVVEIPSNIIGSFINIRFGRRIAIAGSLLIGSFGSFVVAALRFTDLKILRTIVGMLVQGCMVISFNYLINWTVEILPTDLRAMGLGLVCSIGRFGGIIVPWVSKGLVLVHPIAPFIVIGILGAISGGLMFLLPETKGICMAATNRMSKRDVSYIKTIIRYDEAMQDSSQKDEAYNNFRLSTISKII